MQKLFCQQCAELHRHVQSSSRIRGVVAELRFRKARLHRSMEADPEVPEEKSNPDEIVQEALEAQRKKNIEDAKVCQNYGYTARSDQSASADAPTLDPESAILALGGPHSPEELLKAAEINENIRLSVQETSRREAQEDANIERAIEENVSQLQRQRQEAADHQAEQENLRQAIATSETEAQQYASSALEYKKQLERVMLQTLSEQRQRGSDSEWDMG